MVSKLVLVLLLGASTVVSEHCDSLLDFNGTDEAPLVVTDVGYFPANASYPHPAYCEVNMTIKTFTDVIYRFPAEEADWTGIHTLQGCGGGCGYIAMDDQRFGRDTNGTSWSRDLLRKGFAAGHTNMGHYATDYKYKGDLTDLWQWGYNNRTAEINWAYESTHLATIASKALVTLYYGRKPRRSLFRGGSTGGRQALVEVQRYPEDYDGVIVGQPALNESGIAMYQYLHWAVQNKDANGCNILTAADMDTLHSAALASCDEVSDGLLDGVITNADLCEIDYDLIACSNPDRMIVNSTACFNEEKIHAAKGLYSAHIMGDGTPAASGFPPGVESATNFAPFVPTAVCSPNSYWNQTIGFTHHLVYDNDNEKPADWTPLDFDWDRDPKLILATEQIYSGANADLRNFRDRGNKLIFSQGEADQQVTAGWSMDYYERVAAMMGGAESLDPWFRMFLTPGHFHSWGDGPGASRNFDLFDTLLAWLDDGVAPDVIVGEHVEPGNYFTRPTFAWPNYPHYSGEGDWRDWKNWKPVRRGSWAKPVNNKP